MQDHTSARLNVNSANNDTLRNHELERERVKAIKDSCTTHKNIEESLEFSVANAQDSVVGLSIYASFAFCQCLLWCFFGQG